MPLLQLSLELPLQMLQPKKFPSVAAAAAAATAARAAYTSSVVGAILDPVCVKVSVHLQQQPPF